MLDTFNKWLKNTAELSEKRSKNPFFFTYFIILLYRNWEVVYTLFNFDSDCSLNDKIFILKSFFKDVNLFSELLFNLVYTTLVIIISYLLIFIFRVIANFFERKMYPLADKIDDNLIVSKERFNKVNLKKNQLFKVNEDLRNRYEELDLKYRNLLDDFKTVRFDKNKFKAEADSLKKATEKSINNLKASNNKLILKNEKLLDSVLDLLFNALEVLSEGDLKDVFIENYNLGSEKLSDKNLHKFMELNLYNNNEHEFNFIAEVLFDFYNLLNHMDINFNDYQDKFEEIIHSKIIEINEA